MKLFERMTRQSYVPTVDRQEVLSELYVVESIKSFTDETPRVAIAELASHVRVSEQSVLAECTSKLGSTVHARDIISEPYWGITAEALQDWLDRAGVLTVSEICDKFNLSLPLVKDQLLPLILAGDLPLSTSTNFVCSKGYISLIRKRLRGLLLGTTVPRSLQWMSNEVESCDSGLVERLIKQMLLTEYPEIGMVRNDSVFIPVSWVVSAKATLAHDWDLLGWVELDEVRAAVGSSKSDMSGWLKENNVVEGKSCFIGTKHVVRIDGALRDWLRQETLQAQVGGAGWVDVRECARVPAAAMPQQDYEQLIGCTSPELGDSGWVLSGSCMYLADLAVIAVGKVGPDELSEAARMIAEANRSTAVVKENVDRIFTTSVEPVLGSEFGITVDTFPPYIDFVENQVRPHLEAVLLTAAEDLGGRRVSGAVLGKIEKSIIGMYWEIADALAVVNAFRNDAVLSSMLTEGLLTQFVDEVFRFVALRICDAPPGFSINVPHDRVRVIKSVPTSSSADSVIAALTALDRLVVSEPAKLGEGLQLKLRQYLLDLQIVVPWKAPKRNPSELPLYQRDLVKNIGNEPDSEQKGLKSIQLLLSVQSGFRMHWLSTKNADGLDGSRLRALVELVDESQFKPGLTKALLRLLDAKINNSPKSESSSHIQAIWLLRSVINSLSFP